MTLHKSTCARDDVFLRRNNSRQQILLEVSQNLAGTLHLQDVLQATVDGAARLMEDGTAAVYLIEENERELRLQATFPPLPDDFPDHLRSALIQDHPHIDAAIHTQTPTYVFDVTTEVLSEKEREITQQRSLSTLLFVPLIHDTRTLGVFIVGSRHTSIALSAKDIELFRTLANLAAMAVKNARLYEEKRTYALYLEQSIAMKTAAEREKQKLQEELFQARKLDVIGQLAGGVAHDFNNQLSGILGFAELLHMKLSDENLKKYAFNVMTLARRAADLTRQLLAFSRKTPVNKAVVDVHGLIEEVISVLEHTIAKNVTIHTALHSPSPLIMGEHTQIQNAILNLALNARDAMPGGGTLTLGTDDVTLTERRETEPLSIAPGHYVKVWVQDTGTGMDTDVAKRIFEPFFTTKKRGEGSGMGLAAVYGTITGHGGGIEMQTAPGRGSVFNLYFPQAAVADAALSAATGTEEDPGNPRPGRLCHQTILVVDDESLIGQATAEHLSNAGYQVQFFFDGIEALNWFRDNAPSVGLVVVDLIMPKISGIELYKECRRIDPLVRALFCSGFSLDSDTGKLIDDAAAVFLPKPFGYHELLHAVQRSLPHRNKTSKKD